MPKKLPSGISNYEKLITGNYYYVDKTMYIEKLENYSNPNIMLLRPRKFGKSLFISILNYYYDIAKKDKFENLFKDTYIGKNPTELRNSYYMLNFDFSGISTETVEDTINGFKEKVILGINNFINTYNIVCNLDYNKDAEWILAGLFTEFMFQKPDGEIYVVIDNYDGYASEFLEGNINNLNDLAIKNRKVRCWYEILKEGTKTVVNRIFMTGIVPIDLDGLTSGFNIADDLTRDERFNVAFGFTEEELVQIMRDQELDQGTIDKLLPVMNENFGGYRFSLRDDKNMYNSNMCLIFLDNYLQLGKIPDNNIVVNTTSDCKKLENMLSFFNDEENKLIKNLLEGTITRDITARLNPERNFEEGDLISLLFYLGYLTIVGEKIGYSKLAIPSKTMKSIVMIEQ